MTQSCPCGSKQKNFNVLLRRFRCRPDTNLPSIPDLEIGNVSYSDNGALGRVLEHKTARSFRLGRTSRLDLNHDIKISCVTRQRWHSGERNFGVRVQPTEPVCVRRSCPEVWLRQHILAYARDRRLTAF